MATKRCSNCNVNYPMGTRNCPICGHETWMLGESDPDPDWKQRVTEHKNKGSLFSDVTADFQLPGLDPEVITTFKGTWFIHDKDLSEGGYIWCGVDTVVRVALPGGGSKFFEISGRAGKDRNGKERPGWWVELIPESAEMFADLPVYHGPTQDS